MFTSKIARDPIMPTSVNYYFGISFCDQAFLLCLNNSVFL